MTTHVLQISSTVLLLVFGVLALAVWRRLGPERRDRAGLAWLLTAIDFLIVGALASAHSVVAAAAVAAGEKSRLYAFLMEWVVPANAGRSVASIAYAVLLIVLLAVHRRTAPRVAAAAPAILLGATLAGTAVGRLFPPEPYVLATVLAVLMAVTAMLLMAALLLAVLNDGLDQLLWLALAAYTIKETLSVSLLAVLAWWNVDAQVSAHRILYWSAVVVGVAMAALAARRLRRAAAGRHVPALFERLHALRRPHELGG